MTYKENITAILECCFAGFKEEIIDSACNRILELSPTLDKITDDIKDDIKDWQTDIHDNKYNAKKHDFVFERIYEIIDEYRTERSEKE